MISICCEPATNASALITANTYTVTQLSKTKRTSRERVQGGHTYVKPDIWRKLLILPNIACCVAIKATRKSLTHGSCESFGTCHEIRQ